MHRHYEPDCPKDVCTHRREKEECESCFPLMCCSKEPAIKLLQKLVIQQSKGKTGSVPVFPLHGSKWSYSSSRLCLHQLVPPPKQPHVTGTASSTFL